MEHFFDLMNGKSGYIIVVTCNRNSCGNEKSKKDYYVCNNATVYGFCSS